ncbi:hypothetical protein QQP08_002337 [Theobroma cacao]|nr:hypothetical protein QQP08_002337 [Theobroma cacao]
MPGLQGPCMYQTKQSHAIIMFKLQVVSMIEVNLRDRSADCQLMACPRLCFRPCLDCEKFKLNAIHELNDLSEFALEKTLAPS